MKIGFIGAGVVGTAFGIFLSRKSFNISGYQSRSNFSVNRAAQMTGSKVFQDYQSIVEASDIIFITCGDDQIEPVSKKIAALPNDLTDKSFVHMSGAHSSKVLKKLNDRGADTFSLHPMQSFASIEKAANDLECTTFSIEGQRNTEILISILNRTGNSHILLKPEQKSEYHVASCVVSNFLTSVLNFGLERMESIGIDKTVAMDALAPMIQGTIENNLELGPEHALTGPIARGDIGTVQKHLKRLESSNPAAASTYKSLGRLTLELAEKHKLKDSRVIEDLKSLLAQ